MPTSSPSPTIRILAHRLATAIAFVAFASAGCQSMDPAAEASSFDSERITVDADCTPHPIGDGLSASLCRDDPPDLEEGGYEVTFHDGDRQIYRHVDTWHPASWSEGLDSVEILGANDRWVGVRYPEYECERLWIVDRHDGRRILDTGCWHGRYYDAVEFPAADECRIAVADGERGGSRSPLHFDLCDEVVDLSNDGPRGKGEVAVLADGERDGWAVLRVRGGGHFPEFATVDWTSEPFPHCGDGDCTQKPPVRMIHLDGLPILLVKNWWTGMGGHWTKIGWLYDNDANTFRPIHFVWSVDSIERMTSILEGRDDSESYGEAPCDNCTRALWRAGVSDGLLCSDWSAHGQIISQSHLDHQGRGRLIEDYEICFGPNDEHQFEIHTITETTVEVDGYSETGYDRVGESETRRIYPADSDRLPTQ